MPKASLVALDGSVVSLESPTLDVGREGATSFVVFNIAGRFQQFGGGGPTFADAVVRAHEAEMAEQYKLGSGNSLRVGDAPDFDVQTGKQVGNYKLGIWQGADSAVKSSVYDGTVADLIALFELFSFEETANGPTIKPKSPVTAGVIELEREGGNAPVLAHYLPGLGLVEANELTVERARRLPAASGERVDGGELYSEDPDGTQPSLLLVSDSCAARIYIDKELEASKVFDAAASLRVSWSSPPQWTL